MGMLEIHRASLSSGKVAYHELLLFYKVDERVVYGVVEGKDDPSFYRGFIEGVLPEEWECKLVLAGNKQQVLDTHAITDWKSFPAKRICFFVDRDLSEFLAETVQSADNLYITDMYSIENSVVTFRTMERVLEEIFGVTGLFPAELGTLRDLFTSNLRAFCDAMAPVMAQILIWRREGQHPLINDIRPGDIFVFNKGRIALRAERTSPMDRVSLASCQAQCKASTATEIEAAEAEFRSKLGPDRFIRGKYLMWFFVQCATELHRSIGELASRYTNPPKAHVSIGPRNAMALIAPRARCPVSLRSFLDRNYGAHAREAGSSR